MKTVIYTCNSDMVFNTWVKEHQPMRLDEAWWFPEIKYIEHGAIPRHPHELIEMVPKMIGERIVTMSEHIILAFQTLTTCICTVATTWSRLMRAESLVLDVPWEPIPDTGLGALLLDNGGGSGLKVVFYDYLAANPDDSAIWVLSLMRQDELFTPITKTILLGDDLLSLNVPPALRLKTFRLLRIES